MYYVIQTAPYKENEVEDYIRRMVDASYYSDCFYPTRSVMRKYHGEWKLKKEKIFPGYIFMVSDHIEEVYLAMKKIPMLTKLLGKEQLADDAPSYYYALPQEEVEWLTHLVNLAESAGEGFDREVRLSHIDFDENDKIVVVDGPLADLQGQIKKINLHKKIAEVEVKFMNKLTVIHLGLEFLRKAR